MKKIKKHDVISKRANALSYYILSLSIASILLFIGGFLPSPYTVPGIIAKWSLLFGISGLACFALFKIMCRGKKPTQPPKDLPNNLYSLYREQSRPYSEQVIARETSLEKSQQTEAIKESAKQKANNVLIRLRRLQQKIISSAQHEH